MTTPTETTDPPTELACRPTGPAALIEASRPVHWIKNALVAAPLLFSGRFTNPTAWGLCAMAIGSFCLMASGVYLINDVCDRKRDRAHPDKRHRPVASGRTSVATAVTAGLLALLGGLGLSVLTVRCTPEDMWAGHSVGLAAPMGGYGLVLWAGCYLVLNMLYSFWLKSRPIIDVIAVALGFVLRAMAGAAAIAVPISPWLVVCTFTLCLFIALTKRRAEIADVARDDLMAARRPNAVYNRRNLDTMLTISASMAVLTYMLYCLAPATVARLGSAHMVWTIPVVTYGVFRFNLLSDRWGGDPIKVLASDRIMWLVVIIYVVLAGLVVKFGGQEAVQHILEAGGVS
ncbi:MAG: UbiA prenyltransferase family protein [Planctomycetota bacterium]